MRAFRFRWQAPVLAVCCSILAGCAFPGHVETTVKVGLSAPFEGLYRDLGYEVLSAVRLAVRQRNQGGGVGRRYLVEQVALNDFNEAGEAVQQAHEMAVDPGVVGVVGGWSLQTFRAANPEYDREGLAFVAPDMDPAILGDTAARAAEIPGQAGTAVVLYAASPADEALAQAFVDAYGRRGGSVTASLTPAGDNWIREVGLASGAPPRVVFVAADVLAAAGWIVALRDASFRGPIVGGPALGSHLIVDVAGEASEGVVFVSPFAPPIQDPTFVDAYREVSGGAAPGPAASWAYDAANRLLDTIDRAASVRAPSLRAAVQQTWIAKDGGPDQIYIYVIQSGNVYTPYPAR